MDWFKKEIFKKYPSTLYISINKRKYSEVEPLLEHNRKDLSSISRSSSQTEISSDLISSSPETYQV